MSTPMTAWYDFPALVGTPPAEAGAALPAQSPTDAPNLCPRMLSLRPFVPAGGTDLSMTPARLRATARVTQCERLAWRAQEAVHLADVMLRRALRSAADAAAELDDATRQLDRVAAAAR